MCLAVPLRIKEIEGDTAVVVRGGVSRKVGVGFIKDPEIGDYVLVHAGFAIQKVDESQALDSLSAFRELEEALRDN